MKTIALAEAKDQLSKILHDAAHDQIVITRHGKPAGVLIGFDNEDDWFDYKLENDPRFLKRMAKSRLSLQAGHGISWDSIQNEEDRRTSRSTQRPIRADARPVRR